MAKIMAKAFTDALVRAGFIGANELAKCKSITIRVDGEEPYVQITVEQIGDTTLLAALKEFEEGQHGEG